jgi:hypothetical protein
MLTAHANIADVPGLNAIRQNLPFIQVLDAHRVCQEVGLCGHSLAMCLAAGFAKSGQTV